MIKVGDYFKYKSENRWFTGQSSTFILQVTKVNNGNNCTWVILKTLDGKLIKRKLKTRPSGVFYVEHDAFDGGGRNKFDKVPDSELPLPELSDFIGLNQYNSLNVI